LPPERVVLDHRHFIGAPSIIVFQEGGVFFALDTRTKAFVAQGPDAAAVIQKAVDRVEEGRMVFIKGGVYNLTAKITTTKTVFLVGEGTGTRLLPTGAFDAIDAAKIRARDLVWRDAAGVDHVATVEAVRVEAVRVVTSPGYVVWQEAGNYYVESGLTGAVELSSNDRDEAIKYAFDKAPDNSLVVFKLERTYVYRKPKYVSGGYDLSQLTFKIKKVNRFVLPYDYPELSIPITDQRFVFSDDALLLTNVAVTGSTSISVGGGVATIIGTGTANPNEGHYLYSIDTLPFYLCIVLEVDSWTATLGTNFANPMIVITKDASNNILWLYDTYARRFNSYRRVAGTVYDGEVRLAIDMSPPFKLMLLLQHRKAYCYYEKDGKIRYVGNIPDVGFDFNDPTVWRQFKVGFCGACSQNVSVSIRRFKVCHTLCNAVRDPAPVADKYGAPLMINGRAYFTATLATGADDFPSMQNALLSIDSDGNVRLERLLITRRVDKDNKLYSDTPSRLVYDPDAGRFAAVFSGWVSESPCKLLLGFSDIDLRSRGLSVIDAKVLDIAPNKASNAYDASLVYDLSAKRWRIAFANPYPNIYVYENATLDYAGWTQVSGVAFTGVTEGCNIAKVNGKWYILLGKNDEVPYMVATDYPTLANKFALSADTVVGGQASPPHPGLIPMPVGTKCKYVLVCMDRTNPRANLVIMEADQLNDGYEHPMLLLD
jgi:hypothetical protein